MAINFPSSPTNGQTYTSGTVVYTWDGTKWTAAASVAAGTAALLTTGGALSGDVVLNAQSDARFADADSSHWVGFQAPATISGNVTWTLPASDGLNGQVLTTNGTGTLRWAAGGSSLGVILALS